MPCRKVVTADNVSAVRLALVARPRKRETVDGVLALDVLELHRRGLWDGYAGAWTWHGAHGGELGSVHLEVTRGELALSYRVHGRPCAPRVSVAWVGCPFGGARPWFVCPACGRLCGAVYLAAVPACRRCHGLAYATTRMDRLARACHRRDKVLRRLGAPPGLVGLVAKPRRMTWARWERLVAEARRHEVVALAACTAWCERMEEALVRCSSFEHAK